MAKNYVSNKDETVRMFENDFLEALSRVHWTVPLWLFTPVVLFFLYRGIFTFNISLGTILLYFIIGLFIWTFTEYTLHRFIFHFNAKSKFGKKIHFMFHGVHHDYPKDSRRLVMPPAVSIPLATLFYILFYYIFGPYLVAPFFAGFIVGYIFYDTTHYAIHHFNMKSKFWLAIKNHHMLHHYKHSDKGFGVSQPAWDHVFGTTYPEDTIQK
ncbi:MAG: sterol desaturase family protein [Melioribacteraceae bacterium]|nr:sterol desaturase family protein [Melioribacteraceae bacterium]WKZ68057.1 MAG: sterol desaturase family protein [Melioribacteraceae bacterium]